MSSVLVVASIGGFATFNNHVLTGGPYGLKYWLDGSVNAGLASKVYSAKWSWGNATSKIAMAETQTQSAAKLSIHESSTIYGLGFCGLTRLTDAQHVAVNYMTTDWEKAKILLAEEVKSNSGSCPNGTGIVGHEMGHVFGLAHVTSGTALMHQYIAGKSWSIPNWDDIAGINYLY